MRDGDRFEIELPDSVVTVLEALAADGREAVLVGGCVRDLLRGTTPGDWDVASSLPPDQVAQLFPGSSWENRFGTVTVHLDDDDRGIEVTTFRTEGAYRDRRRPEEVRWGTSLTEDLARRDFTINAMAWLSEEPKSGVGRLVDPYAGAADLEARVLRAVGDPDARLAEDALRLLRAARFAARFELAIDPATQAAIVRNASAAATLSGERVHDELRRILSDPTPPSAAFLLMERLGLLSVLLPELAALRSVPQAKNLPGDALEHSLRTADALPASDPVLRLAGLLHDLGKASTLDAGHFIGHDGVGAELADALLRRLRAPSAEISRVARLVRQHMFAYGPEWTAAAVRRFVRRVGVDLLGDLFALRAADDTASGFVSPAEGGLAELQRRAFAAVADDPLDARHLAVDGHILVAELGIPPGPEVGRLLSALLEAVIDDPSLNTRERLVGLARGWGDGAAPLTDPS